MAVKFLRALQDGTITPEKLSEMTSAERRAFLEKIVGKDEARDVNALFESKLLLKDQQAGMITWAKQVGGMTPEVLRDIISRVNKLDRVLNPTEEKSFLNDLANQKLGTDVTLEEAQKISDLAKRASDLKGVNPKMSGVSDEYLKARNEFSSYVESLKPTSAGSDIAKNLAIIGRNNLLLNPATVIKTSLGQIVNSAMDAITRRISSLSLGGSNGDLVRQANAEAWDTFRKTGNNTASMESLDDTHVLNKGENFKDTTGQTTGGKVLRTADEIVRKVARASNKVAIDWEHNVPFTKFYQKTFFDMVNISSDGVARTEGLADRAAKTRAAEVFKDAARIKPETAEGAMVRMEAQKQAARITSTNDTLVSKFSIGTKNLLNEVGNRMLNGFRLGDFIEPMAKIPANLIANGLDNAGAGIPQGIKDIFQGHDKIQSSDLQTRYEGMAQFSNGVQRLIRIGGTLGVAALIASRFTSSDFRQDIYGTSYIRIGNTWINTEYISAISPALSGMLLAKQKGGGIKNDMYQYGAGALASLKNVPGVDVVTQLLNTDISKYASSFFTSRGEPMFISNLLNNRPIQRLFFGSTGVESDAQVKADASAKAKASAEKAAATRAKNKK